MKKKNERSTLQNEGVCLVVVVVGGSRAELGCFRKAEDYRRLLRPLLGPIVGV